MEIVIPTESVRIGWVPTESVVAVWFSKHERVKAKKSLNSMKCKIEKSLQHSYIKNKYESQQNDLQLFETPSDHGKVFAPPIAPPTY